MSDFGNKIRDWDDVAEDEEGEFGERLKPFDGGIMLAVATLFDRWDEYDPGYIDKLDGKLVEAMRGLRETVEQVIA